jgi:hypothetical protein
MILYGERNTMPGSLKTVVLAYVLTTWSLPANAQLLKLSSSELTSGADVSNFQLTHDGTRVVYRGDLIADGVFELFSTSTSAGAPQLKLSAGALADGDIFSDFQLTADGSRVVYRGDLATDGVSELYSASTSASGTQIGLSFTFLVKADVFSNFQITADSSQVVYQGDLASDGLAELYAASTQIPGSQVALNSPPLPGTDVFSDYQITPTGRVVYRSDLAAKGVKALYGASISVNGSQLGLAFSSLPEADVFNYQLTPDGNRVVYRGDLATDGVLALYSASTTNSGTQINLSFTTLAGADVSDYQITQDGSHVIYRGDLTTDNQIAIYSSSTDASGTQISLSSTTLPGADISDFQIAPNGSRVIYRGDLVEDGVSALYSSSTTTSGTQLALSSTTQAGADIYDDYKLLANSDYVVYRGALTKDNVVALYSASTTASGTQIGLSMTELTDAEVIDFQLTPDGSRVVYQGNLTSGNQFDLYSASSTTSDTQVKLNNALSGPDDWIGDIQISADGTSLAYLVGTTTDPLDETKFVGKELFWTPINGGGAISVASANTQISSYQFLGDTFVMVGDIDTTGKDELYHLIWFDGNQDNDQDVDGADFLQWQRGNSPTGLNTSNLAAWEANYGLATSQPIMVSIVPEPSSWVSLLAGIYCLYHFTPKNSQSVCS